MAIRKRIINGHLEYYLKEWLATACTATNHDRAIRAPDEPNPATGYKLHYPCLSGTRIYCHPMHPRHMERQLRASLPRCGRKLKESANPSKISQLSKIRSGSSLLNLLKLLNCFPNGRSCGYMNFVEAFSRSIIQYIRYPEEHTTLLMRLEKDSQLTYGMETGLSRLCSVKLPSTRSL